MKSKTIALFVPSMRTGGAERFMMNLANEIVSKRKLKVHLILSKAEGAYLEEIDARVDIIDLNAKRIVESIFPLIRYIRQNSPLSILATMREANVIATVALLLSGKRSQSKLVLREAIYFSEPAYIISGINAKVLNWLFPYAYRKADVIISLTNAMRNDLQNYLNIPWERLQTIYNPIDIDAVKQLGSIELRHRWLNCKAAPVLVAVGRLDYQKGFDNLLKATALVLAKYDVRLIVLGEGKERHALQRLATELEIDQFVEFHGLTKNPYAYMRVADLFVLSSRYEGMPNALIEALAMGMKIVSTDCLSGPREVLDNGRFGLLVPVDDVEAMAEAIIVSLQRPIIDQKLVDDWLRNNFSHTQITDKYLKCLGIME